MSLFIRLEVSFWSHRKTIRLRALIGDAALWLPQRLWCYAAQNQPDGNFEGYLPSELAMLLGYSGDAQAMLEALQQAQFMDGMILHGWEERNSYHSIFAQRAKKAADARWRGKEKRREEKIGDDKIREETSIACSNAKDATSNACSIKARNGAPKNDDWLPKIRAVEAFKPLNIDSELSRAEAWCMTNHRKCTHRFFLNWLNRALDNHRTVNHEPNSNEPGPIKQKYGW